MTDKMKCYCLFYANVDSIVVVTAYRIIPTSDGDKVSFVIVESKDGEPDRIVSEHATEDDAVEYIGQLRDRVEFWRSGK